MLQPTIYNIQYEAWSVTFRYAVDVRILVGVGAKKWQLGFL